jgi:hypothetical protein
MRWGTKKMCIHSNFTTDFAYKFERFTRHLSKLDIENLKVFWFTNYLELRQSSHMRRCTYHIRWRRIANENLIKTGTIMFVVGACAGYGMSDRITCLYSKAPKNALQKMQSYLLSFTRYHYGLPDFSGSAILGGGSFEG